MKTLLSARFFVFFSAWHLITLLIFISTIFIWISAGVGILLIIVSILDLRKLPKKEQLHVSIYLPSSLELGANINIKVILTSDNFVSLSKILAAPYSVRSLFFYKKTYEFAFERRTEFSTLISARVVSLGINEISSIKLLAYSALGLWVREIEATFEKQKFRCMPPYKSVPSVKLREILGNDRILQLGNRRRVRAGIRDQLHSIRRYQYPDSMSDIDQKASARLGIMMSREYDTLIRQHLIIALDLGRTMCGTIKNSEKYDYYISTALALAREALKCGDLVSIIAFAGNLRAVIPNIKNVHALNALYSGGLEFQASEEESAYHLIPSAVRKITGQRSLIVILSDLTKPSIQEEVYGSFATLAKSHLVLGLGLIPDELEVELQVEKIVNGASNYSDLTYSYWLASRFKNFQEQAHQIGGSALLIPEKYWLSAPINVYQKLRQSMAAG